MSRPTATDLGITVSHRRSSNFGQSKNSFACSFGRSFVIRYSSSASHHSGARHSSLIIADADGEADAATRVALPLTAIMLARGAREKGELARQGGIGKARQHMHTHSLRIRQLAHSTVTHSLWDSRSGGQGNNLIL